MKTMIIAFTLLYLSSAHASNPLELWSELNDEYRFEQNRQSFCYELDQKVLGNNIDLRIRPASVSKLYVTYWALKKLTGNHRFETKFTIKNNELYIHGDEDAFFVSENIFALITKLNEMNIDELNAVHYDSRFYFNWSSDQSRIKTLLLRYLNTHSWSDNIKKEHATAFQMQGAFTTEVKIAKKLRLSIKKVKFSTNFNNTSLDTFSFLSSPLHMHLKQMNIYSTNFLAQKLFDLLGGVTKFHQFIKQAFNVGKETIFFYTGSGLGENYTTCRLTLRLNQALLSIIEQEGFRPSEIISVAGSDLGTLRNRFKDPEVNKTVIAKTGTLRHTSTLSGYLSTIIGQVPFAVFNHTYKTNEARKLQNKFIPRLFDFLPEKEFIEYDRIEYFPLLEAQFKD